MSGPSPIEWTDATWNPVRGCSRVSEGCRNCYAERVAARFSAAGQPFAGFARRVGKEARWTGKVALVEEALDWPLRRRKPMRIFVNSMSDLFHEDLPDEVIDRVFSVMALARRHTFQVLTKRPERMRRYCDSIALRWGYEPRGRDNDGFDFLAHHQFLDNVWLGVSVEDQATADERIKWLIATPAAKRFVSAEPLLGPVDLTDIRFGYSLGKETRGSVLDGLGKPNRKGYGVLLDHHLDWVICGGESGPGARPMHPDWASSLRDQCADAGVPYFFKQWGEWLPGPQGGALLEHQHADCRVVRGKGDDYVLTYRAGKKSAGRLLDGRQHSEMPA